jgi:hypothetical protein
MAFEKSAAPVRIAGRLDFIRERVLGNSPLNILSLLSSSPIISDPLRPESPGKALTEIRQLLGIVA